MSDVAAAIRDGQHIAPAREGAYPLRAGNRVRPLVDGDAAFRRICEAIETAKRSVWVTVAYLERDVPMPDGRGSFFDVLDRAAARGLDVRVIFWREPHLSELEPGSTHFAGTAEERDWLRKRDGRWLARWDRHPNTYCHHQKSWIVDAGGPDEVSFVGGINLVRPSLLASAGHGPVKGGQDHPAFVEARRDPRAASFFEKLAALGDHASFTLAAICGSRGNGHYDEVYVHAKIMLIDDAWTLIGSTNIAERSFHRDTELNASFWHAETTRSLRVELFQEHLGRDTTGLDARAALRLFHEIARANDDRRAFWKQLEGLAYAVDPVEYGA